MQEKKIRDVYTDRINVESLNT